MRWLREGAEAHARRTRRRGPAGRPVRLPGEGHLARSRRQRRTSMARRRLDELDGLVCAAAVLGPIGPVGTYAPADFRRTRSRSTWSERCLPCTIACRALRSGGGAHRDLRRRRRDSRLAALRRVRGSKAAVARLSENLAAIAPLAVNCVAPGFVATRMHEETLAAGAEAGRTGFYERTRPNWSPEGGLQPIGRRSSSAFCCIGEDVHFAGKLISAQWDPGGIRLSTRSSRRTRIWRRCDGSTGVLRCARGK